jgi:lon-related putative ATP-dependent protease
MTSQPLSPEQLCAPCDPGQFGFATTNELEDIEGIIGQARALDAVRFGVGMQSEGFNLYVLGPPGTGKHTAVQRYLMTLAARDGTPGDWVYVNNFKDPSRPVSFSLPAGRGGELRTIMVQLVGELRSAIQAAFESDDYKVKLRQLEQDLHAREEQAFTELHQSGEQVGVKIIQGPGEFTFAPLHEGKVLDPESFHHLPKAEQERIEAILERLHEQLQDILQCRIPLWRKDTRERVKKLNDDITLNAVGHLIQLVKHEFRDLPPVQAYLEEVQRDVITHVDDFRQPQEGMVSLPGIQGESDNLRRYTVNLLVDRCEHPAMPVIYEDNPTYPALVGRVEHMSQMGALVTDFTLVKAGALHRANGGYLILDARKLLVQPYAWEGLKRALYARQVRIESLGQVFSLISTVSLEPMPIPLDLKVVLLGDRLLYYLLCEYDPDFGELFKVAADFEDSMARDAEADQLYARLIATLARKDGLQAFDSGAVARVIQHSMRLVGDTRKLSTHMRSICDLLREADHWSRERGAGLVSAADVQQAIDAQMGRLDRMRDEMHERIQRGIVLIDSSGAEIGQVNGLSVLQLGSFRFGLPARITATTRIGEGEVVDIERETELGGPIHSKGVFILSSYLGARYAANRPLSLAGSLTFEQSYTGVEGDSASLAELCALLSSLARAPIRQSLAVTGSINQLGRVQPIGGVNEKIEGFFDVCRARGLSGEQGVIIPAANVEHLMLRAEVVEAVRAGRFQVYPVTRVDEAIALLTGLEAGEEDGQGDFPATSLNGRVQARLVELADTRKAFVRPQREE